MQHFEPMSPPRKACHLTASRYGFPSLWFLFFLELSISPWVRVCERCQGTRLVSEPRVRSSYFVSPLSQSILMLTWRSITRGIQKSAFHTSKAACLPPRRSNVNSNTSRWGSFERITPASLASVDVRTFPRRPVPDNIPHPSYAAQGLASSWESEIPCLSTQEQIQGLTNACQLAKKVLTMGGKMCLVSILPPPDRLKHCQLMQHHSKPGITTDMIDKELHQAIVDHGAYPSPLNYMGYPKSVCTSVNNIIAHSIPDE